MGQFGVKLSAWNFGVQTGGRACPLPGSFAWQPRFLSWQPQVIFPHRFLVSEILCPGPLCAGGEMF